MSILLGIDVGSSSVKVALLSALTGQLIAHAQSPDGELAIDAPKPGWAEQHPDLWWEHTCNAVRKLKAEHASELGAVEGIGISYQMHGLVCLDSENRPLRPSIIWCDSRAVGTGAALFKKIGEKHCLESLLNSPGNFTASKLAWVKENEPEIFAKVAKFCLPGDYIALRLTGKLATTPTGLSEGILYDFSKDQPAAFVLEAAGIRPELFPQMLPTFGDQGAITSQAASELGISPKAKVFYRAGDQPNNAFSLGVLNPGEIAATAGTSGVVYAVGEKRTYDSTMAVNTFLHVNHLGNTQRYGTLMCLNGCGILYSWLRKLASVGTSSGMIAYDKLNALSAHIPPGAKGLRLYPFGNGAERALQNRMIGASVEKLDFSRHDTGHVIRAAQEGIAFALRFGVEVIEKMYGKINVVRAGKANLFLSAEFRQIFADVTNATVELFLTDGAQGAARGAGLGAGIFKNNEEAFQGLQKLESCNPQEKTVLVYEQIYQEWKKGLLDKLESST